MPLWFVGVDVLLHSFLPLALGWSKLSASHPRQFTAGEQKLYTFWTGFLSIVRSLVLYTQQYKFCWLLASKKTCPKHVVLFQKQIWEISESRSFYYKNILCVVRCVFQSWSLFWRRENPLAPARNWNTGCPAITWLHCVVLFHHLGWLC
jgi:hypothetical protein